MAEEQKPAEVPQETVATEAAAETKVEETPAAAATTEAAPAEAAAPAAEATTEAAPAEEVAKEEVTPIEAGNLEHKGSNFPKYVQLHISEGFIGAVTNSASGTFSTPRSTSGSELMPSTPRPWHLSRPTRPPALPTTLLPGHLRPERVCSSTARRLTRLPPRARSTW